MQRFSYRIHHIAGEKHIVADMFSRWANPDSRAVHADDPDTVGGAARSLRSFPTQHVDTELLRFGPPDFPSLSEIRRVQERYLTATDRLKHGLIEDTTTRVWCNAAGQVYVPDACSLRQRLCVLAHQGEAGHRGSDNTFRLLRERFAWDNMDSDVGTFTRQCLHCLRVRGGRKVPRPWGDTLHANDIHQVLHFDYMYIRAADASTDHGHQYVLVIMDGFSRFVELVPSASADARTVVDALLMWFARFGRVHTFVSDQGSHFLNSVVSLLRDALGIAHHFTAVYAPWSNGRVERVNREIRELLTMLRLERMLPEDKWPALLPVVQSVLNSTPTPTLGGYAPIQVMTRRKLSSPLDVIFLPEEGEVGVVPVSTEAIRAKVEALREHLYHVHKKVTQAMLTQRRGAPRGGERSVDFDVGDFVLYALPGATVRDKTRPLWFGPARVTAQQGPLVFTVQDIVTEQSRTVHATYLKRYSDKSLVVNDELRRFAAHGGLGFDIEVLTGHRQQGRSWQVLVKWDGYEEPTWEPLDRLAADVPEMLRKYTNSVVNAQQRKSLVEALAKASAKKK